MTHDQIKAKSVIYKCYISYNFNINDLTQYNNIYKNETATLQANTPRTGTRYCIY